MNLRNKRVHDAPWLRIENDATAHNFLARFAISDQDREGLLFGITAAFRHMPFENLTKILKASSVISAASAKRHPDEVIGDYLRWGTGGTCFSLTASAVALLDSVGVDAWPVLADRHYGPDTHCGLIVARPDGSVHLLDPGYLLFAPTPIPSSQSSFLETGFNRVELKPLEGGRKIELHTIVKGNRKLRLTFKMEPVSDEGFARAWEQSFAFEMMRYPVITRHVNGAHHYFQGDTLAIRDSERTRRFTLSPEKQMEFICGSINIDRDIAVRALEVLHHGHAATPVPR